MPIWMYFKKYNIYLPKVVEMLTNKWQSLNQAY